MKFWINPASIAISGLLILASCSHSTDSPMPEPDTYQYDNSSTVFTWTAHKFTDRTSVSGTIPVIDVINTTNNKIAAATFVSSSFYIVESSMLMNRLIRDSNIVNRFMDKLPFPGDISGHVLSYLGSNDTGALTVLLNFNKISDTVQMNYSFKSDVLTAKANIDLTKFNTKQGFDSLDVTCHGFHTGADGISKVWSDVDICVKTVFVRRY